MDVRERQSQAARIEQLIQELAAFPDPQMHAKTEELLYALLDMYGEGLAHILEMTAQAETAGQTLIETFARDELVGSLLLLHGLHPVELETRIHLALDKIHSSMQARGVSVKLTCIEKGVASLWLTGNCHGCSSSVSALKQTIEAAIYSAAPDLDGIRFEEDAASQRKAIPVKFVPPRRAQQEKPVDEQVDVLQSQEKSRAGIPRTR